MYLLSERSASSSVMEPAAYLYATAAGQHNLIIAPFRKGTSELVPRSTPLYLRHTQTNRHVEVT